MPERGPSGATISRGPSVGGARVGGGERGFSSVITGGPQVSITRSVGATRVPGLEGRLATPLRPISFSGNAGERTAPSFNRSRLTNISVIPSRPQTTSGRNFIRGLGEFNATDSSQTRRLPQMRPIGEIGHLIDQTGGTARRTDVNRLRRQSDPVILPERGTSGPELRANTVSIVPYRNNRAFDRGQNIQVQRAPETGNRPPLRVENTPPINTGRVSGPELRKVEPVNAARIIPDRKQQTSRAITRIQEQLRQQTVREQQQPLGDRETSPAARPVVRTLQKELSVTQDLQTSGANAQNKLMGKLVKSEGQQAGNVNNQADANEVNEKSVRLSLKHRLSNTKRVITLAAARVRSGGAVDLDELLGRKKKKIKSLDQGTITKKPAEQAAVQLDHRVAEALDTMASLDTQPIAAPARQPLAQPLGVGVLSEIKPDTAVQTAIDTITKAAAVHPQPRAQVVEQKSAANEASPKQKSAAQPENNSRPKNSQREEPGQDKGNYIISRPTQNHRVTAGRNGIWLSFAGTAQERIQAEAILEQIPKPTLQTTSPVLIALGVGQAVESQGMADPTDLAWRADFARNGEMTPSQAKEILVYVIERHQAIELGKGGPKGFKKTS